MLCFRCYDFFPSPFFDVVRGYHITTLDFIKWHSQQPLPASSQLVVTFQWTLKHLIQPILCYTFFCVYLHRFQVNIILTRNTPRDHSISCPSYYLERTIKKPFTGSIVLRYVKSGPIKAVQPNVPLASRSLAESFKNNIFLNSLLILFNGLQKVKAQYMAQEEKHPIFILVKMLTSLEILFIMKLYVWPCTSAKIICI